MILALGGYTSSYKSQDKTELQNMNPKWWAQREKATWYAHEYFIAWLCDPTQWQNIKIITQYMQ